MAKRRKLTYSFTMDGKPYNPEEESEEVRRKRIIGFMGALGYKLVSVGKGRTTDIDKEKVTLEELEKMYQDMGITVLVGNGRIIRFHDPEAQIRII